MSTMLREKLGLTEAPLVEKNLDVVAEYFDIVLHQNPENWISYLRGIDFSKPVRRLLLHPPRRIVRHKPSNSTPKPFLYFANVGVSPTRTGTTFANTTFERFELRTPIEALESTASSISFDVRDRVSRAGGAIQYIIPAETFQTLRRI